MAVNIRFIKNEEGLRLQTYRCGAGHETIGYGHKLAPNEKYPDGITEEKAEELLRRDLQGALAVVRRHTDHLKLNANQLTALVSLVFNCGAFPLSVGTPGQCLKRGEIEACADAILMYRHAHGKGKPCNSSCNGLLNRRRRERALMLTPVNQPPKEAP